MARTSLFPGRTLRLCYWQHESRVLDRYRADLEQNLRLLGRVDLNVLGQLEELQSHACDLLIVAAHTLGEAAFADWLRGFKARIRRQGLVWTPALIVADVPPRILQDIWTEVVRENWYFDIVSPDHLSSLPMRVANLLRIHDHLHELGRYERTLDDLTQQVQSLQDEVKTLRPEG